MDAIDWSDELRYCAALVRTGGDSPRVPPTSVDSYLQLQHGSARNETLRGGVRNPHHNATAAECLTLLQMIRQHPDTDEQTRGEIWRAFWAHTERVSGG